MNWIVYLTTNKENGKLYIGVHRTENPDIFDGYIGNGIKVGNTLKNPKTVFQKALKKYGYTSFVRTTLHVFDNPEDAYKKEAELVTWDFVQKDNNYNMSKGGWYGAINYKPVYQYNTEGELIKIWKQGQVSIMDELGYNKHELVLALTEKVELYQHYWSLTPITDFSEFRKRKTYYLYKCDSQGNLVETYESIAEAARVLEISYNSLKDVVLKKCKYLGYYWTNHLDKINEIIKIDKMLKTKKKTVNLLDLSGRLIQEFNSIKELSTYLGVSKQTISDAVSLGSVIQNHYRVSYNHIANLDKLPILQIDFKTREVVKEWPSITECKKVHPKCKDVLKGARHQTHGFTFKLKNDLIEDIV